MMKTDDNKKGKFIIALYKERYETAEETLKDDEGRNDGRGPVHPAHDGQEG